MVVVLNERRNRAERTVAMVVQDNLEMRQIKELKNSTHAARTGCTTIIYF